MAQMYGLVDLALLTPPLVLTRMLAAREPTREVPEALLRPRVVVRVLLTLVVAIVAAFFHTLRSGQEHADPATPLPTGGFFCGPDP